MVDDAFGRLAVQVAARAADAGVHAALEASGVATVGELHHNLARAAPAAQNLENRHGHGLPPAGRGFMTNA